ncbi:hypothetical protein [Gordonia polyisoprenivorans]|uniref:hypothetical protein n=1 Tax=Gordonia polyisoprenivorans TaxID=84595 RepID=UPI0023003813|nr:hypothetical protein [Gordonia polyisoprenivorans]WCB38743.1 hypothetical protein PHA63_06315 [Gordonia polyisoprenivorans]
MDDALAQEAKPSTTAQSHDTVLTPSPPRKQPPERVMLYAGLAMPVLLMILLPLLYTWGLHSPTPRHMNVSIVGSSQQTSQIVAGIQAKVGSSFDIGELADVNSAKSAVLSLQTRGAYDPQTNTVYVASLGNVAAAQASTTVLSSIAKTVAGTAPRIVDLAPTPSHDALGNTVMFMALGAIMGGFLTATMLRLLLPGLSLRVELAILAVMSAIAGIVPTFIAYSVYSALTVNAVGAGMLLFAFAFVIGSFHLGGMRLIGPAMVLPTLLIMMLFGVPASGGAIAAEMVPGFFTHLHAVLPTPALIEGLKRVVYFPQASLGATLSTLTVWAVIAAALIVLAALKHPAEDAPMLTSFRPIPDPVEEPLECSAATAKNVGTNHAASPSPTSVNIGAQGGPQ